MKQLKFRYWNREIKQFVYTHDFEVETEIEQLSIFFSAAAEYPDTIIQQFTGLLDKHNEEIYEGDLIKVESISTTIIWEVVYFPEISSFGIISDEKVNSFIGCIEIKTGKMYDLEIVGSKVGAFYNSPISVSNYKTDKIILDFL